MDTQEFGHLRRQDRHKHRIEYKSTSCSDSMPVNTGLASQFESDCSSLTKFKDLVKLVKYVLNLKKIYIAIAMLCIMKY